MTMEIGLNLFSVFRELSITITMRMSLRELEINHYLNF